MNNEFNNDEINISDEELNGVSNALDALGTHNNQATIQEWNKIMEETNKEVKKQASRTKMYAIAASILLVAIIGGTVLAVTANGDSKAIKTVDDKDKIPVTKPSQETSTTIPLTDEEALIAGSYTIKSTNFSDLANYWGVFSPVLYDTKTGEKVLDFSDDIVEQLRDPIISGDHISFEGSQAGSEGGEGDCIENYYVDVNLKTLKFTRTTDVRRFYSPSGKKYADVTNTCLTDTNLVNGTVIVDTTTNQKITIKNEAEQVNGNINEASIASIIWVNEDKFVFLRKIDTKNADGTIYYDTKAQWVVADLTSNVSIRNAKSIPGFCEATDFYQNIFDIKTENAKTYALTYNSGLTCNDSLSEGVNVVDIDTGKILWSDNISIHIDIQEMSFGKTSSIVYGGGLDPADQTNEGMLSFGFSKDNGVSVWPSLEDGVPGQTVVENSALLIVKK